MDRQTLPAGIQHGTLTGRKSHGCTCDPCTEASRRYSRDRHRQMAYGRWEPYIDAAPVREHVQGLQAAGLGWMRIARLAGLSTSVVWKLLYGDPQRGQAPSKRVRRESAEKLLAVRPSLDLLGGAVSVDATGTHRRVQALVAAGWTQTKLAQRLGMRRGNFGVMMRHDRVHARTARAVRDLYDELWDTAPPASDGYDRGAITRALRYAAKRGWAPPMAWDDDMIDDPAAKPVGVRRGDSASGMTIEEKREAVAAGTRSGLSAREIGERIGLSQRAVVRHRVALAASEATA